MEEVEAEEQEEFSHRQRLKAAVHYTVGSLCQEVALDKQVHFSKQTIAAISEVTFRQCESFAKDLEMFAREKNICPELVSPDRLGISELLAGLQVTQLLLTKARQKKYSHH
ncbi:centromere protein S isoform X2 [Mastomys coucha]|uniref:centromere protein S isoform X2 n=1 Tax=Mastomys coucha TaxID=35658 RepID=UPI001261D6EA|nr:centromere protein S isoform X2 [Mastomys coucha]